MGVLRKIQSSLCLGVFATLICANLFSSGENYAADELFTFEFIYAKKYVAGENFITVNYTQTNQASQNIENQNYNLKPKWKEGYRLSYEFPWCTCPEWSLKAEAAYLEGKSSRKLDILPRSGFSQTAITGFNAGQFTQLFDANVSGSDTFKYLAFNLTLGRAFTLCKGFSFKPYIGLDFLGIRDKGMLGGTEHVRNPNNGATATITSKITARDEYLGLGAITGVDVRWDLVYDFYLFGKGSLNWVYGHYHLTRTNRSAVSTAVNPQMSKTRQRLNDWTGRFGSDLRCGLGWSQCLWGCWNVDASIAYESIMLYKAERINVPAGRNVCFQGMNISLGVGF